jgi:hypothetical protein
MLDALLGFVPQPNLPRILKSDIYYQNLTIREIEVMDS